MQNGSARYLRLLLLAVALAAFVTWGAMTVQSLRVGESKDMALLRTGAIFLAIAAALGWRGLSRKD